MGDPGRVPEVSDFFDSIEIKVTAPGFYGPH
jgi:hypothetical protein